MCGIAGIHVKEAFMGRFPLDRMANALLLGIESRGRDATGYVAVNGDGQIRFHKAPVQASAFITKKKEIPSDARTVLLHTRFATKGDPSNAGNNHPVLYNSCFTVHNGHINNDDEIFAELDVPRTAEVDSEAISALFSYHGFASNEDIKTALETLKGGFAVAAIDPEQKPGRLVLAKGPSSPLYVLNHKKAVIWASSERAIKDAWGAVLGTPPTKRGKEYHKDFTGMCSVWQGKAWIFDSDDLEVMDFKSTYFQSSYTSHSSTRSGEDSYEYGDWYYPYSGTACEAHISDRDEEGIGTDEDTRVGWERSPEYELDPVDGWVYTGKGRAETGFGSGDSFIGDKDFPQFTCTPSYKACEHPCEGGCNSFVNCTCVEGHPDHPRPGTAIVKYRSGQEEVRVNRSTGEVVEGTAVRLYPCDGCDEYFPKMKLGTLVLGTDSFDLCSPCWEAEGNGPFPARPADEDKERTLRNQVWQRALAETAWELNCSTDYVVWILLECPDDQITNDPQLKEYYEQTAHEFSNAKAIAHDLLTGVYEGG